MLIVDYRLNDSDLSWPGFHLVVGSTHYTSIASRITSVTVNGRNGVVVPAGILDLDTPELTLKAVTSGADADTLMRRFRRLCRHARTVTRIERDTVSGLERRMRTRCVLTSCKPDGNEQPWGGRRAETAVFQLPDVYWQGTDEREVTIKADGGLILPGVSESMPEGWLSDAPIARMLVRFGDASSVRVADPVSGTDLTWSGSRDSKEPYLYLDISARNAWTSSSDSAWDGGTDVSGGVDWSGQPLQVWPDDTTGDYRVTVSQSGGTAGSILCRYLQSWE
ncbi:MAG: hypothetical protein I3I97_02825 [Bifidobacterium thermophilum]|nr:hypothetical protein [Bifidobacterium thermophilum]